MGGAGAEWQREKNTEEHTKKFNKTHRHKYSQKYKEINSEHCTEFLSQSAKLTQHDFTLTYMLKTNNKQNTNLDRLRNC